ncbi:glycosyltransferase [Marinobacter xestospongiae]|uniref:Glycosyltransferase n=1 Tax=Marinobacter xestospongiae TaxID=994319 RepID=A0ABU3VZM3_9GAMM|nr:glycosyltransferase [Marinobacter xestospongiae]MDV2079735.1 glycosyltransferase [Marinobacter xestospongiae]
MTAPKADLQGTKALFIAYFYPPTVSTGVPGSMRTLKFLRNLENGECHVLTNDQDVADGDNALSHVQLPVNGETIHRVKGWDLFKLLLALRGLIKSLLSRVRSSGTTEDTSQASATQPQKVVFKSEADGAGKGGRLQQLKDFIYNLCYFPDQAGPWILPAFFRGWRLVRRGQVDVIFATGSPWSGLLVGYLISLVSGKPWVADFRDPWVNNPFHQSKGPWLDRLSAKLERRIVMHASAVSLNTEPLMTEFLERYPEVNPDKFLVMPNGIDQSDFQDLPDATAPHQAGTLNLCHAGFLYGVRDPASLLDAIREVNGQLAETDQKVVFTQIGDLSLDYDVHDRYADLIEQGSLIVKPAQPYRQCLGDLAGADIVVNIQSGTKTQVPSKLYDYLALEKPILHITPDHGALANLVRKYQLGTCLAQEEHQAIVDYLVNRIQRVATGAGIDEAYPNRSRFLIENITQDLIQTLLSLSRERQPHET